MDINKVHVVGTVESEFVYDHTSFGEDYYYGEIGSVRLSGYMDYIPVMVSSKLLVNLLPIMLGTRVEITGTFRSYNYRPDPEAKGQRILYLFPDVIRTTDIQEDINQIELTGYICREPLYRDTASGRKVSEFIMEVKRDGMRSYYLPILAWSRNAGYVLTLPPDSRLYMKGRIQSRPYRKNIGEGIYEDRIAYEISAYWIEDISSENGEEGYQYGEPIKEGETVEVLQ